MFTLMLTGLVFVSAGHCPHCTLGSYSRGLNCPDRGAENHTDQVSVDTYSASTGTALLCPQALTGQSQGGLWRYLDMPLNIFSASLAGWPPIGQLVKDFQYWPQNV